MTKPDKTALVCAICLDGPRRHRNCPCRTAEPLYRFCSCSAWVHQPCLIKWIDTGVEAAALRCVQCKQSYVLHPPSRCQPWSRVDLVAALWLYICFALYLTVLHALVWIYKNDAYHFWNLYNEALRIHARLQMLAIVALFCTRVAVAPDQGNPWLYFCMAMLAGMLLSNSYVFNILTGNWTGAVLIGIDYFLLFDPLSERSIVVDVTKKSRQYVHHIFAREQFRG